MPNHRAMPYVCAEPPPTHLNTQYFGVGTLPPLGTILPFTLSALLCAPSPALPGCPGDVLCRIVHWQDVCCMAYAKLPSHL